MMYITGRYIYNYQLNFEITMIIIITGTYLLYNKIIKTNLEYANKELKETIKNLEYANKELKETIKNLEYLKEMI